MPMDNTPTHSNDYAREYANAEQQMRDLITDLAPLEVMWEAYDGGRFGIIDGIQHVRRDGSAIVITRDGGWLVGFYTAEEFAHNDDACTATYVECDTNDDVLLAIITEGQAR